MLTRVRKFRSCSWVSCAIAVGLYWTGTEVPGLQTSLGLAHASSFSPKTKSSKSKQKSSNVIRKIRVSEQDDGTTTLKLFGTVAPTFNVFRLDNPDRLVVDVSGAVKGKKARSQTLADTWAVGMVSLSESEENDAPVTRAVIRLKRDSSYIVIPNGKELLVTVTPREEAPEAYFAKKSAATRKNELLAKEREAKRKIDQSAAQAATLANRAKVSKEAVRSHQEKIRALEVQTQKAQSHLHKTRKEAQSNALAAKDWKSRAQRYRKDAEQAKAEVKGSKARVAATEKQARKLEKRAQEAQKKAKLAERRLHQALLEHEKVRKQSASVRGDALSLMHDAKSALKSTEHEYNVAAESRKQARAALTLAKKASKKQAKSKLDKLDREQALVDAQSAELRARKREGLAEERYTSLKQNYEQLARLLSNQKSRTERLNNTIVAREATIEKLQTAAAQARQRLDAVGGDVRKQTMAKAKQELRQVEAARFALSKEVERLSTENKAANRRANAAQRKLMRLRKGGAARIEISRAKKLAKLEQAKFRQAKKRLGDHEKRLEQVVAQLGQSKQEVADIEKRRQVLEQQSGSLKKKNASAQAKLARVESKLAKVQKSIEGEADRLSKIQQRVRNAQSTLDQTLAANQKAMATRDHGAKKRPTSEKLAQRNRDSRAATQPKAEALNHRPKAPRDVHRQPASKVGGFVVPSKPLAVQSRSARARRGKWRGERIDIELQEAPIKDVLLLFSDIGNVNIIAGAGVKGVVTMKLASVPWDQALDIILRSLQLGLVQEGNVIRVATIAALEDERAKAIERANAQVQLKPLDTRLVPLSYATVDEMIVKVQTVLSARGSVTPDSRTNTLIIMDVAENIALAEQLVSQLDTQTPQVLIQARIVEARTNWLRQLGIQWGFDFIASPGTGNPTGLLFPNSVGVAGGSGDANTDTRGFILGRSQANPNYAVDLPAPVGSGSGGALGFSFGSIAGNLNTNLRLSAAEDEGEVRLISAPQVVTLDNIQAEIEQGVQIPISQVSAQGVNTRYVNATLALRVTPHVTNEGSVLLDVAVQKNEADFVNTGARGDPTILTKQAQSRMLITDGDTAVIGGIYTRNQSTNRKKVPWVADIPIIGWFFKNKSEADTRTELLIFITPKIINRSTSIGG